MISTPCDISVSNLKQKLGTDDLEVHRWNGAEYEQTENLKRGEGYFVNVNAVLNSSSICDAEEIRETTTISYIEGWNLIGNPYRKSIFFEELFGGSINDIGDSIYELRGNKFVAITKQDHAKPWRGYWVYAKKDVTLSIQPSIVLTIHAYKTEKMTDSVGNRSNILVGEKLYFKAVAKYAGDDEPVESPDVTWRISNEKAVVTRVDGEFTGIAEGAAEISAEFEGAKSNTITISVTKIPVPETTCNKVVVAFSSDYQGYSESYYSKSEKTDINAEQCVEHAYSATSVECWNIKVKSELVWFDGNKEIVIKAFCADVKQNDIVDLKDISDRVTWEISDQNVIKHVEKERFKSGVSGEVTLTAKYSGKISNMLHVIIEETKLRSIYLQADSRGNDLRICYNSFFKCAGYNGYILKGGTTGFKANGSYGNKYTYNSLAMDISDSATWSVSDARLASIDSGGLLTSLEKGIVEVFAEKDGVKSPPFPLRIVEKSDVFGITVSPSYDVTVFSGGSYNFTAKAYYFDGISNCGGNHRDNECGFKTEDITHQAAWMLSDASAGSIEKGKFSASESAGISYIHAEYMSMQSNSVKIMVKKLSLYYLEIQPEDYKNLAYFSYSHTILKGKNTKINANGYYSYNTSEDCYNYDSYVDLNWDYYYYPDCYYSNEYVIDVTSSVAWNFSEPGIVSIDESGNLIALKTGTVTITATKEGKTSNKIILRVVEESDILSLRLAPTAGIKVPPGGAANVTATAYYMSSESKDCKTLTVTYYHPTECNLKPVDVTGKAAWTLSDSSVGTLENGVFTAGKNDGTSSLKALFGGMESNSISIAVKDIKWMVLTVRPDNTETLPNCPYSSCFFTKVGSSVQLRAFGREESSYWVPDQDLTAMAKWEVSDASVATIGAGGVLTPVSRGLIWIRANVGDARSDKIWIAVMDDKSYQFLLIGSVNYNSFKPMKPLRVGDNYVFTAIRYTFDPAGKNRCNNTSYYNCSVYFRTEDVTQYATWNSSNTAYGKFTNKGQLVGVSQGFVDVSASYGGLTSNTVTIDVWNFQDMKFCNTGDPNSAVWSDAQTKATLETDCKWYKPGEIVYIRYTAEIFDRIYLDNCLDLYVLDENYNIVRTLREEGCTTEPLGRASARAMEPVYQYLSSWDMKDNGGNTVKPGKYFAVARFYILWEPVIRLPFEIIEKQ